jgi:hypothetical protein
MSKVYRYVGPQQIKDRAAGQRIGIEIMRPAEVVAFALRCGESVGPRETLAATFVVDRAERLLVADRRSEHVACAGSSEVLAAGEIFFGFHRDGVRVDEITNQSTGFCPEPESWEVVERVLDRIGLDHPGGFTTVCVFRKCSACGERTIVKDGWFRCDVCGKELDQAWNFA